MFPLGVAYFRLRKNSTRLSAIECSTSQSPQHNQEECLTVDKGISNTSFYYRWDPNQCATYICGNLQDVGGNLNMCFCSSLEPDRNDPSWKKSIWLSQEKQCNSASGRIAKEAAGSFNNVINLESDRLKVSSPIHTSTPTSTHNAFFYWFLNGSRFIAALARQSLPVVSRWESSSLTNDDNFPAAIIGRLSIKLLTIRASFLTRTNVKCLWSARRRFREGSEYYVMLCWFHSGEKKHNFFVTQSLERLRFS